MDNKDEGNVLFPVFLKLHELDLLVVGGGNVGLEKLEAILRNSPRARVTVVGKEILRKEIYKLAEKHPFVRVVEDKFRRKYLRNKDIVVLATDSRPLHEKIVKITVPTEK